MKKFYLKSNNEEVKLGEKLYHPVTTKIPFGLMVTSEEVILDGKLLRELLEKGVIYEKNTPDTTPVAAKVKTGNDTSAKPLHEVPTEISYYIDKIAKKHDFHPEKVANILNIVHELNPMAAMNIVLREIAIEIDKKYKDHIQESPKIFIVSALNGKIGEANKAHISSYRNIAAFRSIDDAKIACKIVSSILRDIFKNGKSK